MVALASLARPSSSTRSRTARGRAPTTQDREQKGPYALTWKTKPLGVWEAQEAQVFGEGMAYVDESTSTHGKCLA